MNKKAQTEDIFADLIPSIILIVVGVFVLYYFSAEYDNELDKNSIITNLMRDRESFSVEGMMEHKVIVEKKEYKTIELIDLYSKGQEKGKYENLIRQSMEEYFDRTEPKIASCFKIKLLIPPQTEISMIDACELKYVTFNKLKDEHTIIPLRDGSYAKIRIEYEDPIL